MQNEERSFLETKKPRYHLRYQIPPGGDVGKNAQLLANFCNEHAVEEVVLFFAAEAWNNGLLSAEEEDLWFGTIETAKTVLEGAGVVVSLNPWATVLHCDRGRCFPNEADFKPMVSPAGETSKACASFACRKWRSYIAGHYGRFASLGFRVIWVEDDFRYHNHGPLTWGGGFEQGVLDRFSEKTGRAVSREEVVTHILEPGVPHPWRADWMETWREIQLEAAGLISEAVSKNAPGTTKVGLMSSNPAMHSTEGRDWGRTFQSLSIDGHVAHRPNFAGYDEAAGKGKYMSIMMLDIQKNFRPPLCETAPEVENFPFTHWTKSDTQTWCEMALALFFGSDALLLNLFPFESGSPDLHPLIGKLLDRSRPALAWIAERFPYSLRTSGIGIPWKEDAQAHVQTTRGRYMTELNADFVDPGRLLLGYGVPVSMRMQGVNAIFGTLAWSFSEDELRDLLSGGLFLDGASADILCKRGFGRYTGAEVTGSAHREESNFSLEMVVSEETGMESGYYFDVNASPPCMFKMRAAGDAREWTRIITPDNEKFGSGLVAYDNELGGRVISVAVPNPGLLPQRYQRQTIIHNAAAYLSENRDGKYRQILVTGGANLIPIHFLGNGENYLVILNGMPDKSRPVVRITGNRTFDGKKPEVTLLRPMEEPVPSGADIENSINGVTLTSRDEIPYLGFLVFKW